MAQQVQANTQRSFFEKALHPFGSRQRLLGIGSFLVVVYVFFFAIDLVTRSVGLLGTETISQIIEATANPFVGLFIGLLSTAILQSSSTTTSMVVALVATGTFPLQSAIPVVMGANIGTTVTSTFVALGHIARRNEFRKAISAAALHDAFNILTILILFPLEIATGFLSKLSSGITHLVFDSGFLEWSGDFSFISLLIQPITSTLLGYSEPFPVVMLCLAVMLLFVSVKGLTVVIRKLFIGERLKKLHQLFFHSQTQAFYSGFLLTSLVQSSSLTTSLIVPMVASRKVQLKRAFPFIIGANIGTTFTALIVAFTRSELAVTIALVHLLINLIGALFFSVPFTGRLPFWFAQQLGVMTIKNRLYGFFYLVALFFLIPFLLIYFSK